MGVFLYPPVLRAQSPDQQITDLTQQNQKLQSQVAAQQAMIEALQKRMDALEAANSGPRPAGPPLPAATAFESEPAAAQKFGGGSGQTVRISADVGLDFFYSGQDGAYANGEFRVGDARIYLDAAVWKNVFVRAEVDPVTRESGDQNMHYGELYADAENLSGAWGQDGLLSFKFGRFYTPFGEEYQFRNAVDNPLVSHSLPDIWDMDGGAEVYGAAGAFSYAAAVQDGGLNVLRNTHTDKSVAVRLSYDATPQLHFSVSGMRTGHLNPLVDNVSALWFANGFFRAIGPAGTVHNYWASLAEGDAKYSWNTGHLGVFGGAVSFGDDSTATRDHRNLTYGSAEFVQTISGGLFGAARYSLIRVPGGYPLAGQAASGAYFFGPNLATRLDRASFGLGYQFGPPLVLKLEYSPEWGKDLDGEKRDEENMFSTELGIRF
jgi:hypothetical protein